MCVYIRKVGRSMLYRDIMAVSCKNHIEYINIICGQNVAFVDGTAGSSYTGWGSVNSSF